jgi:hypothetical protein
MISLWQVTLGLLVPLLIFISISEAALSWQSNQYGAWSLYCKWMIGSEIASVRLPSVACALFCARTTNCTHYSWSLKNGSTCSLQNSSVFRSEAVETLESYSLCGLIGDGVDFTHVWPYDSFSQLNCDWPKADILASPRSVAKEQCLNQCQNRGKLSQAVYLTERKMSLQNL